jgi:hypothetical protein
MGSWLTSIVSDGVNLIVETIFSNEGEGIANVGHHRRIDELEGPPRT